jgi:GT2 family glycosyltransferase
MAPRHVESLLSRLVDDPGCIAFSPWVRFFGPTDAISLPARPTERDSTGVDWLVAGWSDARPMMQSGMFLIPRGLIEEHGGWDERLSLIDDFELFARLISRSGGVRFAPEAGLFYRSGLHGSLSGQKSRKAVESAFLSAMLGTQHLLGAENSARTRRACANILQDFEYTYYPGYPDLREKVRARVAELGGADLTPDGPPGFHKLRRLTGWKAARRIQRLSERYGWNKAARTKTA